jgi:hypothetical protein
MAAMDELAWEFHPDQPYVPIYHEGQLVGYCQPFYASQMVDMLNEQERWQYAMRLACLDIIRLKNGNPSKVSETIEKYLAKTERPKHGPRAIAALLVERQKELQVSPQEFVKFCDTYRISAKQIRDIAEGKDVDPGLVTPLARVLGMTPPEVTDILYGDS